MSIAVVAQERSKAGRRIETWQTKPVDRSISPDQGRGDHVADNTIIFDTLPHRLSSVLTNQPAPGNGGNSVMPRSMKGVTPLVRLVGCEPQDSHRPPFLPCRASVHSA